MRKSQRASPLQDEILAKCSLAASSVRNVCQRFLCSPFLTLCPMFAGAVTKLGHVRQRKEFSLHAARPRSLVFFFFFSLPLVIFFHSSFPCWLLFPARDDYTLGWLLLQESGLLYVDRGVWASNNRRSIIGKRGSGPCRCLETAAVEDVQKQRGNMVVSWLSCLTGSWSEVPTFGLISPTG